MGRGRGRRDYTEDVLDIGGKWRLGEMGVVAVKVVIHLGLTFLGSYCICAIVGFTEVKIRRALDKLRLYQCYTILLAVPGSNEGD